MPKELLVAPLHVYQSGGWSIWKEYYRSLSGNRVAWEYDPTAWARYWVYASMKGQPCPDCALMISEGQWYDDFWKLLSHHCRDMESHQVFMCLVNVRYDRLPREHSPRFVTDVALVSIPAKSSHGCGEKATEGVFKSQFLMESRGERVRGECTEECEGFKMGGESACLTNYVIDLLNIVLLHSSNNRKIPLSFLFIFDLLWILNFICHNKH